MTEEKEQSGNDDKTRISEKEEYFKALGIWYANYVNHVQQINAATASFYCHLATQFHQPTVNGSATVAVQRPPTSIGSLFGVVRAQRQDEIINREGGYEFKIAPLWKRFMAEVIDVCILFLLKLMITFALVDIFDLNLNLDIDLFKSPIEENYNELLNFTSELLVLEIITKLIVCLYEAIWTAQGQFQNNTLGGATPGKMLLGVRILYVEAVALIDPVPPVANNHAAPRALLYPAQNLGFKRALMRALAKNIFVSFLFPICFVTFLNRHNNRTIYDVLTKTVVVEEQMGVPVLRRRENY